MTNLNVNRNDVVSAWQNKYPLVLSLNVGLVHYLPTYPSGHCIFFVSLRACACTHTSPVCGQSGWLAGSNALYHAKLDWIKVWTRWVHTFLMKGIFSTFGSVKSSLLNRTGNKMRSCFFFKFPFKEQAWLVIEEDPAAEV